MKICNVIYSYSPYNCGGADIYAENISKYFAKIGHESIVITTKPYSGIISLKPSIEYVNGIKVYRFYPFNIYFIQNNNQKNFLEKAIWSSIDTWNLHTYKVIKNILAREKPDVVHLHTPISFSFSVFNAAKGLNIPLILTLHDYFLLCKRCFLLHGNGKICSNPNPICKLYRNISKRIVDSKPDVVISPSKFALDIHTKEGLFKKSKKIVLPNGIEVPEEPIPKIKKEFIDIFYIGTILQHKGIIILIEAFKKIESGKLRLHIAGTGPLLNQLKELSGDDNRITFYGFVSDKHKENLFNLADIFVLPSIWYENFPVSIQEAFCCSTPVIGSSIGGIPELIQDGYNGFLFEPGNIEELKNIFENLANEPIKLKKMGKNAFESVKEFDMKKHTEKLEEVYEDAIKKNGKLKRIC